MGKRTTRFLNISLVLVAIFCIFIFVTQTLLLNFLGENTIRQLGVFYMSGISEQVSSHFGTTIELRLSQVESLVNSVPPGRSTGDRATQISLTYNARSAGFEYLAFYSEDGSFQMIYGAQMTVDVPEDLYNSVQGGKHNVCAGKDSLGTPLVLMGVPAVYPMEDGNYSMALVAGLPTSYLGDTLENNIQGSTMEYSIIRNDGSYVLQNHTISEANYFERVEDIYEPYNGKKPKQYAEELHHAMDLDIDYTCEVLIDGERWNVYCTALPNSDWHLLLKISHNTLDETINQLQRKWSNISIGGCCLIVCALMLVFAGYYRQTKLQMRALNDARKTAEEAQLSAERSNRAKNEFLSNMSHDIRTPMNGIMGMTSIAIGNLDDPVRVRACLKRIHVSSRHLLGLINDMLDMSKIESGSLTLNMEPISLREIMQNIETIIQPQIQEKQQRLHIYVHDIYYENVCSDRVRLSQILLNILGNSVKYTPEGGSITMELYEEPSPKGDGYIRSRLHVWDTGIGMSKEFQERIFDAFAREDNARVDKTAGAGMGMAITKYIVDAMGGSITVESERGKGSHFHITVDMEKASRQEKDLRLPPREVLVVEDDEMTGRLAVAALDSIGLQGKLVDVSQVCRILDTRRSDHAPWPVVLMNWEIQGQDGVKAARALTEKFGRSLPVIILSEGEWYELESRAEGAGISAFISKPLFRSGLYYGLRPFAETQENQAEQVGEEVLDLTGRRILLAEDNELNWEIASELLSEVGLELDWAEDGKICAEKFEASEPGWYDAILMDLRMPVMNGFEATAAIRKMAREDAQTIPIIAVSADAFEDDVKKCMDVGMNAHSAKPLNPEVVLSLLRQYLH